MCWTSPRLGRLCCAASHALKSWAIRVHGNLCHKPDGLTVALKIKTRRVRISRIRYRASKNSFMCVVFPFERATLGVFSWQCSFPTNQVRFLPLNVQSSSAGETYTFITAWDHASLTGTFKGPGGISVDSGGNVHVADTGDYRIQKFTADDAFITEWGTADAFNHCVQKFSPDGVFVTEWGSFGRGSGLSRKIGLPDRKCHRSQGVDGAQGAW